MSAPEPDSLPQPGSHAELAGTTRKLEEGDRKLFVAELGSAFNTMDEQRGLLRAAKFPETRIPQQSGDPRAFWDQVLHKIELGVGATWEALLAASLDGYPGNGTFGDLATRYGFPVPATTAAVGESAVAVDAVSSAQNPETVQIAVQAPSLPCIPALSEIPTPPAMKAAPAADITGYTGLLANADRPDHGSLIALWKGRIGSWDSLNDFQRNVLIACRSALAQRGVALVYAVTNSGKTTLARIAMTMALNAESSAIMLLPTKALVTQEVAEWKDWHSADGLKNIKVYGSSRDYPENDRPVSRGRYDVAVAIYEKLGVYLVSGRSPLSRSGLVVVDELQTLVEDSERAAKLEALLTLIKMLPRHEQPAILGLSAALDPAATEPLRQWLGAGERVVVSNERPVPLDTYVVDQTSRKVQKNAHLLSMPGAPPLEAPEQSRHGLMKLRRQYERAIRGPIKGLPTGELAVALVADILEKDPNRRIICFVPSRTAASELATAIQRVLKADLGRTEKGTPWEAGRFAGDGSRARDHEYALNERVTHSDLPERDEIIRGLKEGVAPHSSRFAPMLRRLLEEEFRSEDGLLRVLVATDTLAVGINLPADTVIATSISGWSGTPRRRRVLTAADLDNKGGRAGRRGQTAYERGEFYILVPEERELQEIDGLTNQEMKELSSIDGVFRAFVTSQSRSGVVRSKFRDPVTISGLVLQVLCQDGFARTPEMWEARVREILDGLLITQEEGTDLPSPGRVQEELAKRQCIGTRSARTDGRNGKLALTGMGLALGRSGMELDAARDLERLARLACDGAGTIDLLWNACRSKSIESVTEWVTLPPVPARHLPSLKDAVITMALAYCADTDTQRRDCAQFVDSGKHHPPERLVAARNKVISPELRHLLYASQPEEISRGDVNALLRSVVAYEWMFGIPFGQLRARFNTAIRSDEKPEKGHDPSLKLHYSDVEQLCEQLAGVIRAAADISHKDGIDHSGKMRLLALEVEAGLPSWLAAVSKMRLPSLHRQRLAQLWDAPRPGRLAEVLDHPALRDNPGITNADRQRARDAIEAREVAEEKLRNVIARQWADQDIPDSGGRTFDDLADELNDAKSSVAYLDLFGEVVTRLGVDASEAETQRNYAVSRWSTEDRTVTVKVPHERLTAEMVEEATGDPSLIVVRGTEVGVDEALKLSTRARFVQPEHVLSLLATLVQNRGDEVTGHDVVGGLGAIKVSSLGADGWYLINPDTVSAPPPFEGPIPAAAVSGPLPDALSDDVLA
ncbi:DEAD/DEAH box helicase [Streptomyces sp. NBC_00091]|uniref:DEAD/DEAH box helicase n=1 Tax=Streptomyces sp. NBC_00091 TaxID=2975648 RepID=UPI00224F6AB5|nr:DEAD/DEAH box helicase [Streptomyces sp. NBC_00091]MCX5376136.1 DEAD/DEAH box helicase [Streptomyces sp. NBC_00091]